MPGNTDIHAVLGEGNRSRLADAGIRPCHNRIPRVKAMLVIFPAVCRAKPTATQEDGLTCGASENS